ncbi:MAG: hypothetical protein RL637_1838 [Pseudomonadota bacterium]|jgi:hypothetical protein
MKKINLALVRLLQFVVFVVFTFTVLIYFSAMILLPLDAVALLIKFFGLFGVNSLIACLIAIPIVSYLALMVYKIPLLTKMVIDTGIDLVNSGKAKVEAFNQIADSVRA